MNAVSLLPVRLGSTFIGGSFSGNNTAVLVEGGVAEFVGTTFTANQKTFDVRGDGLVRATGVEVS